MSGNVPDLVSGESSTPIDRVLYAYLGVLPVTTMFSTTRASYLSYCYCYTAAYN